MDKKSSRLVSVLGKKYQVLAHNDMLFTPAQAERMMKPYDFDIDIRRFNTTTQLIRAGAFDKSVQDSPVIFDDINKYIDNVHTLMAIARSNDSFVIDTVTAERINDTVSYTSLDDMRIEPKSTTANTDVDSPLTSNITTTPVSHQPSSIKPTPVQKKAITVTKTVQSETPVATRTTNTKATPADSPGRRSQRAFEKILKENDFCDLLGVPLSAAKSLRPCVMRTVRLLEQHKSLQEASTADSRNTDFENDLPKFKAFIEKHPAFVKDAYRKASRINYFSKNAIEIPVAFLAIAISVYVFGIDTELVMAIYDDICRDDIDHKNPDFNKDITLFWHELLHENSKSKKTDSNKRMRITTNLVELTHKMYVPKIPMHAQFNVAYHEDNTVVLQTIIDAWINTQNTTNATSISTNEITPKDTPIDIPTTPSTQEQSPYMIGDFLIDTETDTLYQIEAFDFNANTVTIKHLVAHPNKVSLLCDISELQHFNHLDSETLVYHAYDKDLIDAYIIQEAHEKPCRILAHSKIRSSQVSSPKDKKPDETLKTQKKRAKKTTIGDINSGNQTMILGLSETVYELSKVQCFIQSHPRFDQLNLIQIWPETRKILPAESKKKK